MANQPIITPGGGPTIPAAGSVTPGSITTSPGDFIFPGGVLTEGAVQPTTPAAVVAYNPSTTTTAIAVVGAGINGSPASSDGVGIALMYSSSNNRQLGFFDTGAGIASSVFIRMLFTPGASITATDGGGNTQPLNLGGTGGVVFGGKATLVNLTTTQKNAIPSPQTGDLVFDTTLGAISVYYSGAWHTVTSV